MMINNPSKGLRLIDLIPQYTNDFDYTSIYTAVNKFLYDLKPCFYSENETLWNNFIERFCDRYYSDYLNFETFLDFKIKLKCVLNDNKEVCQVIAKAKTMEYDLLATSTRSYSSKDFDDMARNVLNKNDTTNKSDSTSTNKSDTSSTNTDTGYNLHSDTPSDSVNVKDLASSKTNYVTDVQNDHSESTSKGVSSGSATTNTNDFSTSQGNIQEDSTHTRTHEDVTTDTNKNAVELINSLFRLNNDICKYLLDEIDKAHLFSNTYYF